MVQQLACIGTGNLAHHLTHALRQSYDYHQIKVFGRKAEKVKNFAHTHDVTYAADLNSIDPNVDVVFLMVNDDQISPLSDQLVSKLTPRCIMIHFSGAVGTDKINSYFEHRSCVWPIQTFSAEDAFMDLKEVPFCTTSSSDKARHTVDSIFSNISNCIVEVTVKEKAYLHLAAVFANNFTNHMLSISEDILHELGYSLDIMRPIVEKTISNAFNQSPTNAQTGPARRGDITSIANHQELLKKQIHQAIYNVVTDSIKTRYKQ